MIYFDDYCYQSPMSPMTFILTTYYLIKPCFPFPFTRLFVFTMYENLRKWENRFKVLIKNLLFSKINVIYCINISEISGELLCKNMISSHMKITLLFSHMKRSPFPWLHYNSSLLQPKTVSVKYFGFALVFTW